LKKYWKSFGLYAAIFVIIAMLIAVAGQKADRSSTVNYTYSNLITALEQDQVKEIQVQRSSEANDFATVTARLVNGDNILIFPEGTRKNKDDEGRKIEQLPFKLGTVSIAQKTGAPILPTSIYYGRSRNYVKFSDLFFVRPMDNLVEKNNQLENIILNMTRKSKQEDEYKQKSKKIVR